MSRTMTLNKMFNIEAIAVIHASNDPYNASHQIINTMIKEKYKSTIFPANPTQKQVLGLPCRPSLIHMENRVDLPIVSIPAESFFEPLKKSSGRKGIRAYGKHCGNKYRLQSGLLRTR